MMKTVATNGKKMKNAYTLLQKTGQGIKMAADTGYKTGYFMAKHPNIKMTKDQIAKNYKIGLLSLAGLALGIFGIINLIAKNKED